MRGFQTKKQREASEPAQTPLVRGFAPGHEAAKAQAQNQAPDSIPAMVKPGEFVLPPDTVHAMGGKEALQGLVDATHSPAPETAIVPRGFEPQMFFAQGGAPEDEWGKRNNSFGDSAASSLDSRVAQIPTGGYPKAPAADGSQSNPLNTEVGRNLSNIASALPGSMGSAIPAVARTGGAISSGINSSALALGGVTAGAGAANAGAKAVTAFGGPDETIERTPLPKVGVPNPTDTRLAGGTQSSPGAPAVSEPPMARGFDPNVTKTVGPDGRVSYSGANVGGDIHINGQAPRNGGGISSQNMAAADNLARGFVPGGGVSAPVPSTERGFVPGGMTAPIVRHSGNDWQARTDLRNAKVSADSITNTRRWGGKGAENNPDVMEYQALLRADTTARGFQPGMDQEAMRQNGALQREGLQQDGATERSVRGFQVDQQRVGIEGRRADSEIAVRGFQTRAARQQEELRGVLTDPKATPQQRTQAQQALQALTGKGDSWKAVALQGGTDAQGNKTESMLGAVNERTGEMKRMGAEQGGAMPPGMVKQVGTSGGKPVYEDANGKRFVAAS